MSRAFAKLLDPSQLTHVELEAWSHLAEHASTANVFLDPLFVLPAVRHLPGASRARLLVVAPSPRRWSAVVLVMPGSRWRRLPLPALGTWVHDQQGLATPLLDGADPSRAAVDLVAAVSAQEHHVTLLGLDEQAADGQTHQALQNALITAGWHHTVWRSSQRAQLLRAEQHESVLAEPARLRTKRRRLERDSGQVQVRDCSGPDLASFAASTLLRLEAGGWKGRQHTSMTQRPGEAAMLREVVRVSSQKGNLRALVLLAGERAVAAQIDLVSGDTWFHWKTAYDEVHAATSPGRLLLTHVLERFEQEESLRRWDACTAPGHPMERVLPHRRTIVEVAASRGRLSTAVVGAARRVRDRQQAHQ